MPVRLVLGVRERRIGCDDAQSRDGNHDPPEFHFHLLLRDAAYS
jgi:hypothetical protein